MNKDGLKISVLGLPTEEHKEISKIFEDHNISVEVGDYQERAFPTQEVIKFVFYDLPTWILTSAAWDIFKKILISIWKKYRKPDIKISGWITIFFKGYSVNISLPSDLSDLENFLSQLPLEFQKIQSQENTLQGKIVSLAFDIRTQAAKCLVI